MHRCMGTKTISLEDSAYSRLKAVKRPGESFSDAVNRVLGANEPSFLDFKGTSWLSPRGIKVDFYTRDVGRIPVTWILDHAVQVKLGKKKEIKVICLEGLMLAKHRAGRTTDVADLRQLMTRRGGNIDWNLMAEIAEPLEIAELRKISKALAR